VRSPCPPSAEPVASPALRAYLRQRGGNVTAAAYAAVQAFDAAAGMGQTTVNA
jgi:hypothetical protein